MTKMCKGCAKEKPLTDFYPEAKGRKGRRSRCIPCYAAYTEQLKHANLDSYRQCGRVSAAKWRKRNPAEARRRSRENQRQHVAALRARIREKLGGKCTHCDVTDARLLHIDHKNDDGNIQRAAFGGNKTMYLNHVLLSPGEYQLLCPNCNHRKRIAASSGATTRQSAYTLRYAAKSRVAAFTKLGGTCQCGERDAAVLCIDHVDGGGTRDRKRVGGSVAMYLDVLKATPGKYQILCHNCNWLKRHANAEWGPYCG